MTKVANKIAKQSPNKRQERSKIGSKCKLRKNENTSVPIGLDFNLNTFIAGTKKRKHDNSYESSDGPGKKQKSNKSNFRVYITKTKDNRGFALKVIGRPSFSSVTKKEFNRLYPKSVYPLKPTEYDRGHIISWDTIAKGPRTDIKGKESLSDIKDDLIEKIKKLHAKYVIHGSKHLHNSSHLTKLFKMYNSVNNTFISDKQSDLEQGYKLFLLYKFNRVNNLYPEDASHNRSDGAVFSSTHKRLKNGTGNSRDKDQFKSASLSFPLINGVRGHCDVHLPGHFVYTKNGEGSYFSKSLSIKVTKKDAIYRKYWRTWNTNSGKYITKCATQKKKKVDLIYKDDKL